MQVNSNVTFNAYEGGASAPKVIPVPINLTPLAQSTVPEDKSLATNSQYQAQLDTKLDTKKALDTVSQNTIINIGLGAGTPAPVNTSITNSPLPISPAPVSVTGSSVSDKFLESFSKMLEGFLASMNKLLDTFLNKMTDILAKSPSQGTTPASGTTTSPTSPATTPTPTSPTPIRNLKTWEQKASEYIKGDEKGMISESDLQEAVVKFQIYQKTEKGEKVFIEELEKAKATTTNRQTALKTALKNTIAAGAITQAEADFVYSISFKASQFDAELDKISTAKATGGLSTQNAIQLGAVNLTMIQAGESKLESRSIDSLS